MKRRAGREKAIELAIGGMKVRDICGYFNDQIPVSTISQWLTDARRRGAKIPYQTTTPINHKGRPRSPTPLPPDRPKRPIVVKPLTPEDEFRLAELARRDIGLTSIAAHMRKPYGMIAEAMQRLGLSRAGDVTISTRVL